MYTLQTFSFKILCELALNHATRSLVSVQTSTFILYIYTFMTKKVYKKMFTGQWNR